MDKASAKSILEGFQVNFVVLIDRGSLIKAFPKKKPQLGNKQHPSLHSYLTKVNYKYIDRIWVTLIITNQISIFLNTMVLF